MKTIKVTQGQYRALQTFTRKNLATLKKYPAILVESRHLVRGYKKILKRIGALTEHANKRKRHTAYKRIVEICRDALARVEK